MLKAVRRAALFRDGHLKVQRRWLNIHENGAYSLLREAGIPTPPFGLAHSPDEAAQIATELGPGDLVLKAQVLAGGRGKGNFIGTDVSGVVMCYSPDEAKKLASKMLGKKLVTKQTGPEGRICNSVMVTTRMFSRKELYLSVMMERSFNGPVIISSSRGGVNIEDVAATSPEAIKYTKIDILEGLNQEQAKEVAASLGIDEVDAVSEIVCNLYNLFVNKDALLLEINPLAQDSCGQYFALDCKCSFDDSAEYRQPELFSLRDPSQKEPSEVRASAAGLNYVALDGNIGCMVNGAGLAMATMDIIKLHGGEPANFLDVGGSAVVSTVKEAFQIISSDPKVESIFVNIFGGIMRCDVIAEGIIEACKDLKMDIPVVVRLQGTNSEKGQKLILDAKLNMIPTEDLTEAAQACVDVANIIRLAKKLNLNISMHPREGVPCPT